MANLMDYLVWRGEFGFDPAPWNEVDALRLLSDIEHRYEPVRLFGRR